MPDPGRMRTRSAVKETKKKETQARIPAASTANMDLISTGMHVDIKRSDGRVHTAVVTETRRDRNVVMVEWFEKNETKGKEIDLEQLLAINPTLRRRPLQPVFDHTLLDNDENDETLDDIIVPIREPPAPSKPKTKTEEHRKTMHVQDSWIPPPKISAVPTGGNKPLQVPKKTLIAPPSQTRTIPVSQSTASTPVVPINNIMVKSADRIELNETLNEQKVAATKGATVQNIEKLQKERDERRAQQEMVKKAKEMEKAIDPGNPNYQFLLMIREYQSNIDYRPLKMTDPVTDSRISVCVRKRPLNKKETTKKEIEVVTIPNRDHLILHQPQVKVDLTKYLDNQKFRFDYTFDENTTNEMVYKFTAQPLVKTVFEQGFATCFAYDKQTGSGKTHTMGGDFNGKNQNVSGGIYALTAADVFTLRNRDYKRHNLTVNCSFFEIYGSKVFDLLNGKQLLRVLEDSKKEVNVVGLKEETVECETDVLELIKKGTEMRTAGATSANSNSSRSHAVFQIVLKKKDKLWGKFSLIDLAGNERGQDTGNTDQQTRMEGAEINKSLLALKECIRAMAKNSNHIPFRTSRLTLVLRDSFIGENAKTCMIAMISPGMSSCEHTLNTLRYADRVKELGADEGGAAVPMADDELMLAKRNSDDEEDEKELSLIYTANGTNQKELESIKLATKISTAEDKVLSKQLEVPAGLRAAADQLDKLIHRTSQVDYDHEKYANDLLRCCNQQIKTLSEIKGYTDEWLALMKKEAEIAKSNEPGNTKKK